MSGTSNLTRRETLAGAASTVAIAGVATGLSNTKALAQPAVPDMRDRAARWLAMLPEDRKQQATLPFENETRKNWSFMHGSNVAPGLPLERMTESEKDGALDLLSTGLSEEGLATAMNIMLQQDILRDEWNKGRPDRNRERFSLLIFGDLSPNAIWGWRFEGHHLSLNYTLKGDDVTSVTPSSFSSEPNTVPSGPHSGLVVLPVERLGRDLFADLNEANRRGALINQDSFGNILTTAGNEDRVTTQEGLPLGDLPQDQIDRITRLIEIYTVDHLPGSLAETQSARIREGDLMATRFAWAGPNEEQKSVYYRLHGETFLIEFATLRNQPQHHHAIRHDFTQNFGAHAL